MPMTLKHMDVAQDRAAEVLAAGERPLVRFQSICKTARGQEDRLGVLAVRSQLLDYLAAAHLLNEEEGYSRASEALLEHAQAFVERFQPTRELLLVELSLALIRRRRPLARALAKAVLGATAEAGQTLENYQAQSLAALLDLDYAAALRTAAALAEACERKAFDKSTCAQGAQWADAVQLLASGDGAAAEQSLQALEQLHIAATERELGKLKRGGASAFAPFDMLDLPGAALLSLIEAFGHTPRPLDDAALACGYGLGLKSSRLGG